MCTYKLYKESKSESLCETWYHTRWKWIYHKVRTPMPSEIRFCSSLLVQKIMVTFPERSRSLDLYCIHVLLKSHQETGHSNFTLSWQSSSAEYNLCLHFDTFFLGVPQRSLHFCTSKANHEMHTFLHVLTINMHSYLWYFFSIASLIHEYHPSKKNLRLSHWECVSRLPLPSDQKLGW